MSVGLSTFSETTEKINQFDSSQTNNSGQENQTQTDISTTNGSDQAQTNTQQASPETGVNNPDNNVGGEPQEADISDSTDFSFPGEQATNEPTGQQTSTTQPQTQQQSFNLDEELAKVTDKKALLKKLGVTDFALEMNEHLQNGGQAEAYLSAKAIDYNKVGDEVLIKSELQRKNPNFSPSQIDFLFNRQYVPQEDASEDDKQFMQLTLQSEAHRIRGEKIAEQQKFKIQETPIYQTDPAYDQWKRQSEEARVANEQYANFLTNHSAVKSLNESKKVVLNFGDGVKPFNINISNPELVNRSLMDDGSIWKQLTSTETGEPDVPKQQLITIFAANPQKFIQDVFNYGQNVGRKKLVGEGQNAARPASVVNMDRTNQAPSYSSGKFGDKSRN